MASDHLPVLPQELDAKFRYLCQSRTIHGSLQAKCYFLHDGKEYSGILFSPDGEDWFDTLEPGTIVKANRIGPCLDERYLGEYKGTALPHSQQSMQKFSKTLDVESLSAMLRDAADILETYLKYTKIQQSNQQAIEEQSKELEFRSASDWADIVSGIIGSNTHLQIRPFSGISLNAYIEGNFDDFWEGDLVKMCGGVPRWRRMVARAITQLLDCGFIERVPGTQKHYQVTQETLAELF